MRKNSPESGLLIAVIGGGKCTPSEALLAEEVGRELAKHKAVLVCGGLGGIMEAACRGASLESGLTVGILPGDDPADANPYVRIPVVTGIGQARNLAVVKSSRAVIAIDGEYGTLSEIAFALSNNIPVIGLNTWQLSRNGERDRSIIEAKDAADAVEKAISIAVNSKGR
jgi:uncharacterized protein (TIGR00725 family)